MGGEISKEKLLNHDDHGRLIPTNFYAAIDKKLYGFGIPVSHDMLKNLQDYYNVGLIITLLLQPLQGGRMVNHQPTGSEQFENPEYCDTDKNLTEGLKIKFVHLPIHDGYAPHADTMKQFIQLVKQTNASGKAVGVHCWQGVGRTGTMLCGYLMQEVRLRAQDAMNMLGMRSGKYIKSPFQIKYLSNPNFPTNPFENDYPETKIITPQYAKCYTQPVKDAFVQSTQNNENTSETHSIPIRRNSFITNNAFRRTPSISGSPKSPPPKNFLDTYKRMNSPPTTSEMPSTPILVDIPDVR